MATKAEVFALNSYAEVEEGFPMVAPGRYLVQVTEATVEESKAGQNYVRYTPLILESDNEDDPTVDKNDLEVKGRKMRFDSLYLTANPLDKDGKLRDEDAREKMTNRMRGQTLGIVRRITGEEPEFTGTEAEVAQSIRDAIAGMTYVATIGIRGAGANRENTINAHESSDSWGE